MSRPIKQLVDEPEGTYSLDISVTCLRLLVQLAWLEGMREERGKSYDDTQTSEHLEQLMFDGATSHNRRRLDIHTGMLPR